jgi:hypothetical protein
VASNSTTLSHKFVPSSTSLSAAVKDIQHNGQQKKDKRTNNDLQNIHIKLKI